MMNKKYVILLVVIIALLVIYYVINSSKKVEKFTNLQIEYEIPNISNNKIGGSEEGQFAEYKNIESYSKYPRGVVRFNELDANRWETRLPSLINQRYMYNDNINSEIGFNNTYDPHITLDAYQQIASPKEAQGVVGATLTELPINMTNRYRGVIDDERARTSLAYWPDVTMLDNGSKQPYILDKPYEKDDYFIISDRYRRDISGYNPASILPGEKADRSKTSNEALVIGDLIKERRDEPNDYSMDYPLDKYKEYNE